MKFRPPQCPCKPGSGQMRWQPSLQAYRCMRCNTMDATASPEDMTMFKKVRAMNEALITESIDSGKLSLLLQVLLSKMALEKPNELSAILQSLNNKPAAVEVAQEVKKKTRKAKEETEAVESKE